VTSGAAGSDAERAGYVRAYDEAKAAGDHEEMAAAALRLSRMQMFGTVPGRIPAFLHEAYQHAEGRQRIELAIAIARAWGYGYEFDRAREFATEAVGSVQAQQDPALMAAALDVLLVVSWGPDDFDERLRITALLEDTAAHLSDVEVQMSSYLWRLTTALEGLDVPVMRRQLRNLDRLAADTGSDRVRFFAAARRGMHALLVGDVDSAERARSESVAAGEAAGEADAYAIDRALTAAVARQRGDLATVASEAAIFEAFGLGESVPSVAAEGAQLWIACGEQERAERLLHQLAGPDFARIAHDVDWLLTMTALTEVAAALGHSPLCARSVELLAPYAGRGVSNAGAVTFGGVVDHYLSLAHAALGDDEAAAQFGAQALAAYEGIGAMWWASRCRASPRPSPGRPRKVLLRPGNGGAWEIGAAGSATSIRDMRGLHYLRVLLANPGKDISARQLSALARGTGGDDLGSDTALPVADDQALAAYRSRLQAINDELDMADRADNPARSATLTAERDALIAELRRVTGRGGRMRTAGGTDERARVAVRKAIAAAIAKIEEVDASVARALAGTVSTGIVCRYQPDPDRPTSWQLS
jgi:hypothetical protein